MDNNKNITNDLKRGSQSINETKINKIVKNTQNELNYTSKIKQNINNTLVTNNHIPKQNTILIPYIQVTNALPMVKSNTEKNSNNNSNHPKKGNLIKLFSFLAFFFTPLIITGVSISLFSIKSHKMNNTNLFNNQVEEYSVKNNKYSINDINDENINLVMSGLINGEKIIPQGFSASYLIIEKNKSENYIKVLVNLINKNDEIYNKTCIIKGFNTKEYNISRNSIDISGAKNTLLSQIKIKSENNDLFLNTKLHNSELLGGEFNKYSNLDEIKNDLDLDIIGMTKDFGVRISIEKQEVTDFSENSLINILNIKLKLEKGNDIDYLDFFVKGFKSLVDIKQEFDYFVKKKYSNFDADYITMHIAKDFNSPFLKKLTYEIDFNNNPTRIF